MSDREDLETLLRLRERAGLTQHEAARHLGVRRKTYVDWETGKVTPRQSNREPFLEYLLQHLGLRNDLATFYFLWEYLAVERWNWNQLSRSEKWLLDLFDRSASAPVSISSIPPALMSRPLVGRQEILHEIKLQLTRSTFLAIIGMAGVGKTAVAIALAQDNEVLEYFHNGIMWVSLGQDPNMINSLGTMAADLGIDVTGLTTVEQRRRAIRRGIGSRRILIIIDDVWAAREARQMECGGPNCAHLLLTRTRSVAIGYAAPDQLFQLDELDDDLGFELLTQEAPDVCATHRNSCRELVSMVGGLPLAIVLLGGYLSAPHSRYFAEATKRSIAELADAQHRLQLVKQRLGEDTDNERSLQQVIELSLDNVPKQTVQIYHNLGAFAAKPAWFQRNDAEAVAGCGIRDLSVLIDRNLLEIGTSESLTMHQVVADHARTKMQRRMPERHRNYFLEIAAEAPEDWRLIERVYEQVRWAWKWQLSQASDSDVLCSFVDAIWRFQFLRGLWREYIDWAEKAVLVAKQNSDLAYIGTLLNNLSIASSNIGDRDLALAYLQQSRGIQRQLGDICGEATYLVNMAAIYTGKGKLDDALEHCREALSLFRQAGDRYGEADTLNNIGTLFDDLGQKEDALEYLYDALHLSEQIQSFDRQANALSNIANVHIAWEDYSEALGLLQNARSIIEATGNRPTEAVILHNIGSVYLLIQNEQKALVHFLQALHIQQETNDRPGMGQTLLDLGELYLQQNELNAALDHFLRALQVQEDVDELPIQIQTYFGIGQIYEAKKDTRAAITNYKQALEIAEILNDDQNQTYALVSLGEAYYQQEDYGTALAHFLDALPATLAQGNLIDEKRLRYDLAITYETTVRLVQAESEMLRVVEIARSLNLPELAEDLDILQRIQQAKAQVP